MVLVVFEMIFPDSKVAFTVKIEASGIELNSDKSNLKISLDP